MEDEKILIDRKTLKAISSDTRMDILKYLSSRKYTLSELSKKTKLKNPTIKEHLDNLIDSGLVKREESDNKWKYYSLTEKGQKLVKPKEIKVLISFVISLFVTLGLIGYYIINFFEKKSFVSENLIYRADIAIEEVGIASSDVIGKVSTGHYSTDVTTPMIEASYLNIEIILLFAIIILLFLTIFLFILTLKEKNKNKKDCIKVID